MVFLRGPKGTTWTLLNKDEVQFGVSAHLHASHRLSIVGFISPHDGYMTP